MIAPHNSEFVVMDQDWIADRVERIGPVPLDRCHLLKKIYVLQGEAQQIGNVSQVSDLVLLKFDRP